MKPYYQNNLATIYHGDCLDVMSNLEDVALVVTSPPYNMRTRIRNGEYTTREWSEHFSKKYDFFSDAIPIDEYYRFHSMALKEMLRLSPLVFWNVQIVTGSKEAVFKIIGKHAMEIKDVIIWDKGNGQPAMHTSVINRASELILIFERNAKAGRAFSKSYFKRGEMTDIWRFGRGGQGCVKGHKAVFPYRLPEKAITGWSKKNDVILDPFMGTGTTLLAGCNNNRQSIGIEISEQYCEIAATHIEAETKQLKLFNPPDNKPFKSDARGAGGVVATEVSLPLAPLN